MTNIDRRKNALFFLQADVGGAERITAIIGKLLDKKKYNVKFILVANGKTSSSIQSFIPTDYEQEIVPRSNPFVLLSSFYSIICEDKPDIVFASVFYLNNKLLLLKLLFPKIKFVIRCENYLYTFSLSQKIIMGGVYFLADKIITQTKEMEKELISKLKISPPKINTIENPVDVDTITSLLKSAESPYHTENKKVFIASGRFARQKGFDILIDAFSIVNSLRLDCELYIVGAKDGDYDNEFQNFWKKVVHYGLENKVHCEGFMNNPYPYVKFADCFVLSSRWEGLPNVLLESLFLGTPVAAFNCIPVIERIVQPGINGFLAEKENASSLAQAMLNSLELHGIKSRNNDSSRNALSFLFDQL